VAADEEPMVHSDEADPALLRPLLTEVRGTNNTFPGSRVSGLQSFQSLGFQGCRVDIPGLQGLKFCKGFCISFARAAADDELPVHPYEADLLRPQFTEVGGRKSTGFRATGFQG
jgi:hypothetical protein